MRNLPQKIKNKGEQEFADLLISQGKEFFYQPANFHVNRVSYRPDFYISVEETFYEVVRTRQAYFENKRDIALVLQSYPFLKLRLVNPDGSPYKYKLADPTPLPKYKLIRFENKKNHHPDENLIADFIRFQKEFGVPYKDLQSYSTQFDGRGISAYYLSQIISRYRLPLGGRRIEHTLRKLLDFLKQKYSRLNGDKEKVKVK